MGYIFISYSRKNSDTARRIVQDLQTRGYTVWVDSQDLSAGENWNDQVERAILDAEAVVTLLSPDAVGSRTVQNEIALADSSRKPIIPVAIHPSQIPSALMNHQVVDASGDWDVFIDRLVNAIDASTASLRMSTMKAQAAPPPTMMPAAGAAPLPMLPRKRPGVSRRLLIIVALVVMGLLAVLAVLSASAPAIGDIFSNIVSNLDDGTQSQAAPQTTEAGSSLTQAAATSEPLSTATAPASTMALQSTADAANDEIVGTRVSLAVQGTVAAFSATESNVLSPAEGVQMVSLTGTTNAVGYLAGILGALALGTSIGALVVFWRSSGHRVPRQTAHPSAHPGGTLAHPDSVLPEQMLEDYHIFASSSDKDKDWVRMLVDDLEALGYLVWWYAKDAPGLPFGNEIRSAIYHTKIFMIVVSPDSMRSKHIEEEIRWAEIYDRPIITVLCRATSIEERLYGLAKGADVDFTGDYKEALEFAAQAIDHYLQQRLEKMQIASPPEVTP